MNHSRPIDPPARKRKPRRKVMKSSSTVSRTALNPQAAWPFPTQLTKSPAVDKPRSGLRYIDSKGVERVYSFRERQLERQRREGRT